MRYFATGLFASQMAPLSGLNRNTINRYLHAIRGHIAGFCKVESPFAVAVEVDESLFGARRMRGKQ